MGRWDGGWRGTGSVRGTGAICADILRTTLVPAMVLAGCELEEVTIVDPTDVVVAEVNVQLQPGLATSVTAFLHRTLGPQGESLPVDGAAVTISRKAGGSYELAATDAGRCVSAVPVDGTGSCYWLPFGVTSAFQPGDELLLRIDLPGGGLLESRSVVPGAFDLVPRGGCQLPQGGTVELRWTPSKGAWAYVNETLIYRLDNVLRDRGLPADSALDPLYLLGLSVSAADTTIVFPREFGLFNRFDLDANVALILQEGLPVGTSAMVTVTAADRNYVNWVRGGSFNPSGQVRVPSVRGDGTGVFASTYTRGLVVETDPESEVPPCTGVVP